MFRTSLNRALLTLRIETRSPLRIGSGDSPLDPSAADLVPARTRHALHGPSVFVPGTSLKGALRASAELRLRDRPLRAAAGVPEVCDPLRLPCSVPLQRRRLPSAELHRNHCPCCRLFGSSALRGRAAIRDHFPWRSNGAVPSREDQENAARANRLELRHRIAIDRRSGSIAAGPFDAELVPAGVSFHGEIALENYQIWQLGLLLSALDELNDGFAQLGAGRSEGLGLVQVAIESIVHEQASSADRAPAGVGALARPEDRESYGLLPEVELPAARGEPHGLHTRYGAQGDAELAAWLGAARSALGALA
jgi:CRISPR-associated RAMP protein (TIGR02581 family)